MSQSNASSLCRSNAEGNETRSSIPNEGKVRALATLMMQCSVAIERFSPRLMEKLPSFNVSNRTVAYMRCTICHHHSIPLLSGPKAHDDFGRLFGAQRIFVLIRAVPLRENEVWEDPTELHIRAMESQLY